MKNRIHFKNILLICLIAVAFVACKTSKSIQKGLTEKAIIEENHALKPAEVVIKLQEHQPAFRSANVNKMSVFVDFKNRQLDVKATCKIVSDSALHLSIQPFFGIELFKLELTPESMIIIDKANRRFYESNYGIFKSKLGIVVNYDAIQSLISNRLFVSGKKAFSPADFSWKNKNVKNTLFVQAETMSQEVVVDLALVRIAELILKTNDNAYTMSTAYSNFKNFDGTIFPEKIKIDGVQGKNKASFHFTMEDVKFNVPVMLAPTDLTRYTRGDVNSFIP